MVGFFQGPVDEQRGALRAAGIALGQQLQIPDDHRQRGADIVGNVKKQLDTVETRLALITGQK